MISFPYRRPLLTKEHLRGEVGREKLPIDNLGQSPKKDVEDSFSVIKQNGPWAEVAL